ncbi:MAG: Na+/H+ antiporter subunit E [Rhodobacterales bacterium]|nr:Na+/H+ antiporter subunit E [Rhodobacterales bacterium]
MIRRILPHPALTLMLTLVWLMLVQDAGLGSILLGLFLGFVIPILTAPYWPDRPRLRNPVGIAGFVLIVLWDICIANVTVARLVLFRRNADLQSRFITIPLELTAPEAIAVLAGTITLTPGTVSADLSADGRALLVHCLHAPDPDAVINEIKDRYERRLKEIFP